MALLLALVFSASVVVISHAQADGSYVSDSYISAQHEMFAEMMGEEFATNYFRALEHQEKFYDSLPRNRMGDIMHPNNFGGTYIDDYGNLVVLVVGSSYERGNAEFIQTHVEDGVLVREVAFAYNELWEMFHYLRDFIMSNRYNPGVDGFTRIAIDIINNNVAIYFSELCDETIALFRHHVSDSPMIIFGQRNAREADFRDAVQVLDDVPYVEEIDIYGVCFETLHNDIYGIERSNLLNIRPGDCFFDHNRVRRGSIGYRAIAYQPGIGHVIGFMIAAHSGPGRNVQVGDTIHNSSGQIIGFVLGHNRDIVDAAFVRLHSQAYVQNTSHHGWINPRVYPNIGAGTRVITDTTLNGRTGRMGAITQWISEPDHFWFWIEGWEHSAPTRNGDSGGMVYTITGNGSGIVGLNVSGWSRSPHQDDTGILTLASWHTLLIRQFPGNYPRPR